MLNHEVLFFMATASEVVRYACGEREVRRMAKGSHRRPDKRKKKSVKESDELKDMQRIKKQREKS